LIIVLSGCDQKPQVRQYTEVVTQLPPAKAQMSDDPHAGLDMTGEGMMAGQPDPHAGLDMSAVMPEGDPHAGLDMPAIMGSGRDPHAGLDMSSGAPMMAAAAETNSRFAWSVPEGWTEEPAQGMRLATFRTAADPKKIDVSIVTLGGMAGGLESNLKRWLGQIGIDISNDDLQQFIKSSKDNIFDFTQLQKSAPASSKSMIAAIIMVDENTTVFVKMAGTVEAVGQEKANFLKLVKSVHAK
jgi:hypothetical protein